jgi:hypothetical protein
MRAARQVTNHITASIEYGVFMQLHRRQMLSSEFKRVVFGDHTTYWLERIKVFPQEISDEPPFVTYFLFTDIGKWSRVRGVGDKEIN